MSLYFFESLIYIGYSFLAPVITAGGGILVSNVLTFLGIGLVRATGLTSMFFMFNGFIVVYIFRQDIVWSEVKKFLPLSIIGSVVGALFLINVNPTFLLFLMFCFSIYFIYKKLVMDSGVSVRPDSFAKEQGVAFLSGALTGTALPGGGFRNSYFLSRGFTIQQMHGTTNFIGIFLYIAKLTTMFNAHILTFKDLIGILIAFPFLILSNYLLRKGLIRLPKKSVKNITVGAMALFSAYALVVIIKALS